MFDTRNHEYVPLAIGTVAAECKGGKHPVLMTTADGIDFGKVYTLRYELRDGKSKLVHAESIAISGARLVAGITAFSGFLRECAGPLVPSKHDPEILCRELDPSEHHWKTDKQLARFLIEVWFERKRNRRPLGPDLRRLGFPYPKWIVRIVDRAVSGNRACLDLLHGAFGFYLSLTDRGEVEAWNTLVIRESPVPQAFIDAWEEQPATKRLGIKSKEEFLELAKGSQFEIRPFHRIATERLWEPAPEERAIGRS